jgi:hypothetical protein
LAESFATITTDVEVLDVYDPTVPEITPVLAFRVSPLGSVPEEME